MASSYSPIRLYTKKSHYAIAIDDGNGIELITRNLAAIIHSELLGVKKLR